MDKCRYIGGECGEITTVKSGARGGLFWDGGVGRAVARDQGSVASKLLAPRLRRLRQQL